MINKKLFLTFSVFVLVLVFAANLKVSAVSDVSTSSQALTEQLRAQVVALQQQLAILQQQIATVKQTESAVKETSKDISQTFKLIKSLRKGMSGNEVKLLQEILATDSDIYPEGKITGYFGFLTEKAVKKFQAKFGISSIGLVGPKTIAKINEILTQGAGKSGKVPHGLLRAPGILKKLGLATSTSDDDDNATTTPTTTPDVQAPVISGVGATSTLATSTSIVWTTNEAANSKVWYATTSSVVAGDAALSVSAASFILEHLLGLPDLIASTTYYYFVESQDTTLNTATSSVNNFQTK